MFSLIITVISIALVASLALATLYYGGSAFGRGHSVATASRILNQAQQLMGAADAFEAETKRKPLDLNELVASGYLKSVPTLDTATWAMPVNSHPVFVLQVADLGVCRVVNLQAVLQQSVALRHAYPSMAGQCYGPDPQNLRAVFKRPSGPTSLDGVLPAADISLDPVPTSGSDPDWLVAPQ